MSTGTDWSTAGINRSRRLKDLPSNITVITLFKVKASVDERRGNQGILAAFTFIFGLSSIHKNFKKHFFRTLQPVGFIINSPLPEVKSKSVKGAHH